ncbi:hypothetical protein SUGI_0424770 [Cryptomeria japonica]|uniref:transcription factor bHLH119 n=1 Tax=Cryptomeria japonica TaxID=3369 RepID=UPI002408F20C|nr:transcription factor bHLH119 [Cryptomeria japonica]GLJ22566.1 hypothetical protein SUGI_0424770 [Cryptomeria japonica]
MATLDFLDNASIEIEDYLLERNGSVPSSFTIPLDFIQGEENNQQLSPLHLGRTSRTETESFSSRRGKENAQSTSKKLYVDMDSHYTDSQDEFPDLCRRFVFPRGNTSSKRHRAIHVQSSKRHRSSHVHNLSEKRRRNRINEKLKTLQLLIPNSQKTDKASILEEAIEYVKQLQLQVQMLSSPNKMNPSNTKEIPSSEMPQMCISISLGFTGTNMTPSHSPWQWNSGSMTMPHGVQGQTIPPWANEQNKKYFHTVCLPMFKKNSERNNTCEAGSRNTSQPQSLSATHTQPN